MIPASYGHLTDHRQSHRLPSYFVRTVFPFATKEQKFEKQASREKSPKCLPGGGEGRKPEVFEFSENVNNITFSITLQLLI